MVKKILIILLGAFVCFCCYQGYVYYKQADSNSNHNVVVKNFSFQNVIDKARELSKKPYVLPDTITSSELLNLSYDQYRDIRFIRENGP
mgnify:CR=1 FL=1